MTDGGEEPGGQERTFERYEQMLHAMHDAACVYDEDGHFELVNQRLAEFYDTTRTGLEGRESALLPRITENHEGAPIRDLWDGDREEVRGEIEGEFRGHGRAVLEYRLTPLVIDGEVDGLVGVAREVTERKRRETRLREQNERLDQFASVVSHDLRNPLNVAIGRLQMAREERESSHLDAVARSLDRMEALIDDLLLLARHGQPVGDTDRIDLSALAEDCWATVDTAAATLVVDTTREIEADRSRLRQLFENLFRNSVEHGGEAVTVTVGDCPGGFYVADDGVGLPDRDDEDLFAPGVSTADEGTGFGLSIVRSVCEGLGWEITVTESATGGARFEITGVDSAE